MSSSRVKLTKTFIDQLAMTPAIFRDIELIGFAIRVNSTCKTYIVEKKVLGKTVRSTIGLHGNLTLIQARDIAQDKLAQMTQGINPNKMKCRVASDEKTKTDLLRSKPTLEEAFKNYLRYKKLKERTICDYTIVIHQYLEDWKLCQIDAISQKMIQEKHTCLSQNSKARANMAMRIFRAIYNFSVEYYLDENHKPILDTNNPVKILNAKKSWNKIRRRKTYIKEDQIRSWIKAVFEYQDRGQKNETNRDFLLSLILTGFRREDCESLSWSNINLQYGLISSINFQNGESHTLPMGDFLFTLMKKRRAQISSEWVFPSAKSKTGHITNISKVRNKINNSCNIHFTFDDLRRTFGSIAKNLDDGCYTMKHLLNHKENHHRQISERKLREVMNTIENIILGEYKTTKKDELSLNGRFNSQV